MADIVRGRVAPLDRNFANEKEKIVKSEQPEQLEQLARFIVREEASPKLLEAWSRNYLCGGFSLLELAQGWLCLKPWRDGLWCGAGLWFLLVFTSLAVYKFGGCSLVICLSMGFFGPGWVFFVPLWNFPFENWCQYRRTLKLLLSDLTVAADVLGSNWTWQILITRSLENSQPDAREVLTSSAVEMKKLLLDSPWDPKLTIWQARFNEAFKAFVAVGLIQSGERESFFKTKETKPESVETKESEQ